MSKFIDTILFDLDDTLIIEWKSAEESFLETKSLINSDINSDEFLSTIRKKAKENWYKLPTIDFCLKIGISSWEALWADFTGDGYYFSKLRELSASYRTDTWHQTLVCFNINDISFAENISLEFKRIRNSKHISFPETENVLKTLKNKYNLGLITNGAPDLQWKKIKGANLENYFDFIAISGEHGFAKPDTRLFDLAIKGCKSSPGRTIMVGDNLNTDIKGGLDSGIKTIWINRNNNSLNDIKPDYELPDLNGICNIIYSILYQENRDR